MLTYEKALDILMKVGAAISNLSLGLWISDKNYCKVSTEQISTIYRKENYPFFNYSLIKHQTNISVKFDNGSIINLMRINKENTNIRGKRYDFLIIDNEFKNSEIYCYGQSACTTLFPPTIFSFTDKILCSKCLCKTCYIAYENGGAEGCGDCLKCKTGLNMPTLNCKEYYNPEAPRINYKRREI